MNIHAIPWRPVASAVRLEAWWPEPAPGGVVRVEVPTGATDDELARLAGQLIGSDEWLGTLAVHGAVDTVEDLWAALAGRLSLDAVAGSGLDLAKDRPGPLLLQGDTGTGKTELARFLHKTLDPLVAGRAAKPLRSVNCAAIPTGLLEAEMRGVIKGTATEVGARPGWFEGAHGGLLFLDEFQETAPWFQAQLLDLLRPTSDRVAVCRVGADEVRRYRVRTVLAINRALPDLLDEARIRLDLVHRIRTVVRLPTVEEQLGGVDMPRRLERLLAARAWLEIPSETAHDPPAVARLSAAGIDWIRSRRWPGNWRELERVMSDGIREAVEEAAFQEAEPPVSVEAHHLSQAADRHVRARRPAPGIADSSVPALAARAMAAALRAEQGRIRQACLLCGPIGMRSERKFRDMLLELRGHLDDDVLAMPAVRKALEGHGRGVVT